MQKHNRSLGAYLLTLCHILNNVVVYSNRFEAKHLLVRKNKQNYHHSEINGLATKNTTFTALSHTQLTGYSTAN